MGHDMNADTRTLLQVKLEDAVAAENIFTTLMVKTWKHAASLLKTTRWKS